VPTISIGWLLSPSINLKLEVKRFAHHLMVARLELAPTVG
jgi:hypothetical protein